jgi:hypothetical protein
VQDHVIHYSVRETNGNAILKSTAPWDGEDHVEHTVDTSVTFLVTFGVTFGLLTFQLCAPCRRFNARVSLHK